MRGCVFAGLMSLSVCGFADAASADHAPVYVIPMRPDAPIIINGRDASYAIVEGDWGLSRPGSVAPTVIYPAPAYGFDYRAPHRHYFPATGKVPRYGRREIIPAGPQILPQAESYHRSWSTSAPSRVWTDAPSRSLSTDVLPPYEPPRVIVAPRPLRRNN
jgi:hypothetical protein